MATYHRTKRGEWHQCYKTCEGVLSTFLLGRWNDEVTTFWNILISVQNLVEAPDGAKHDSSLKLCQSTLEELTANLELHQAKGKMRQFGLRAWKWPFSSPNHIQNAFAAIERHKKHYRLGVEVTADLSFSCPLGFIKNLLCWLSKQDHSTSHIGTHVFWPQADFAALRNDGKLDKIAQKLSKSWFISQSSFQHAKHTSQELESDWSMELTLGDGRRHQICYFGSMEYASHLFSYCNPLAGYLNKIQGLWSLQLLGLVFFSRPLEEVVFGPILEINALLWAVARLS